MISKFPAFGMLQIEDKTEIESFLSSFPPYADFNFFSMWTYNTENKSMIAKMNNILIVLFQDYIEKDKVFCSFIGENVTFENLQNILELPNIIHEEVSFAAIPEVVISAIGVDTIRKQYPLLEDEDNFDYILSVEKMIDLKGKKLHQKAKRVRHFMSANNYDIVITSISNSNVQEKILLLFNLWRVQTKKNEEDVFIEKIALSRGFRDSAFFNSIFCLQIIVNGTLVGFAIFEMIPGSEFVICGFQKGDQRFPGIYEVLTHETAKHVSQFGYKWLNIENDMGLAGLREAKMGYDPLFLKKYKFTLKDSRNNP